MKKLVFSIVMLFTLSQFAAAVDKPANKAPEKAANKAPDKEVKEAAAPTEKTFFIKTSGRDEKISFELMSPADFKQLLTQLALEEKLYTKAMTATEKAWREDESTKKKPFPRGSIVLRKAEKIGEYADASKAADALARKEKEQADRIKADKEKADKRAKDAEASKKKSKEQLEKEQKRDAERESVISDARNLFDTKLQELITPAEGAADQKDQKKEDLKGKEEPKGKEAPKEADKKAK
jgi:hypothetical protein